MLLRYNRRKSLTPSYLNCIFTLAASGVYADLRLEYVNQRDTPIHERTPGCRSLRKAFSGVKINHQKDGAANVKYGRRNKRIFLRRLRKSYANRAVRKLRSRRKH